MVEGTSIMKEVSDQDEWCAEAYLDTDYDAISPDALATAVKRHVIGRVMVGHEN